MKLLTEAEYQAHTQAVFLMGSQKGVLDTLDILGKYVAEATAELAAHPDIDHPQVQAVLTTLQEVERWLLNGKLELEVNQFE